MERRSCTVVRASTNYKHDGGVAFFEGITADRVGATEVCVTHYLVQPQGEVEAHLHENHEAAMFIISGRLEVFFGPQLTEHVMLDPGDFFYIPPMAPHRLRNCDHFVTADTLIVRSNARNPETLVPL